MQSSVVLLAGFNPRHSPVGIAWTAVTAVTMFAVAAGKAKTGEALDDPVLRREGRVTAIDGIVAAAVLIGLVLNAALGWWGPTPPPVTSWCTTAPGRLMTRSTTEPATTSRPAVE